MDTPATRRAPEPDVHASGSPTRSNCFKLGTILMDFAHPSACIPNTHFADLNRVLAKLQYLHGYRSASICPYGSAATKR
jgi:hypothetical protein